MVGRVWLCQAALVRVAGKSVWVREFEKKVSEKNRTPRDRPSERVVLEFRAAG